MAKARSLKDLFMDQLKDLYSAENQIIKAVPKMAKQASTPELQQAFQQHLEVSQRQKERLDQIFQQMGTTAGRKKCKGMEGLLAEGTEMMQELDGKSALMDAGLIAAAQKVEHYEIASYGTARTYANLLGNNEAANLLNQTLQEEGDTDHRLTQLAESGINMQAEMQGTSTRTRSHGNGHS